jgi:5,10-methylene-tetrahydrofolate dehydrogenase/methenyl tetrahydrofolate cyclohydrolase
MVKDPTSLEDASVQVGNRELAAEEELKEKKGVAPGLAMLLVGDRQDSQSYVGRPSKLGIPLFGTLFLLAYSVGRSEDYILQLVGTYFFKA